MTNLRNLCNDLMNTLNLFSDDCVWWKCPFHDSFISECARWVASFLFVLSSTGSRHPQKDSPHHWHCSWPPPSQQIHRISSSQRAAPEGVPLQTHPVPKEGLCTQEGRQLCKFVYNVEEKPKVQMVFECFVKYTCICHYFNKLKPGVCNL